MRAGVCVLASLAVALPLAVPAAVAGQSWESRGDIRASARVVVREVDRQREAEYRKRHGLDDVQIDYRHYHGERRGPHRMHDDSRRADDRRKRHIRSRDNTVYSDGGSSIVYLGEPAKAAPTASRADTDSFDNLAINHASGYKQIIVGGALVLRRAGVDADDLFKNERTVSAGADSPSIIYLGGSTETDVNGVTVVRPPQSEQPVYSGGECRYGVTIIRGRPHMYGVEGGQTPVIASACR